MRSLIESYGDRFLFRIFSKDEVEYAKSKSSYLQTLAGRFAAKEAVIKATGKFVPFSRIEILNSKSGIPYVNGNDKLMISISHEKEFAVAVAVEVSNENSNS